MHLHILKLLRSTIQEKMHLQENTLIKVTQNVVQYPLHHVRYAPSKSAVATSDSLKEMHLQEKTIFDLEGHRNIA